MGNKSAQSNLGRGPRRRESKSPSVTTARPTFAPISTFPWTDRQTPLPASSLVLTPYDVKRHADLIRRFPTMHWTDRRTDRRTYGQVDRPTDRPRESLIDIGRCVPRATRPNNKRNYVYTVGRPERSRRRVR